MKKLVMHVLFVVILTNVQAGEIILNKDDIAKCSIVYSNNEFISKLMATRLADYIKLHSSVSPVSTSREELVNASQTLIILSGDKKQVDLNKLGVKVDLSFTDDRQDGFILKTLHRNNQNIIIAAGNTERGAKYAVYELMIRQMKFTKNKVVIPELDIKSKPHVKDRIVGLFNIWKDVGGGTDDMVRKYNSEGWNLTKMNKYINMFDQFGYSGFETHDRFSEWKYQTLFNIGRDEWKEKVINLSNTAHANGQVLHMRSWASGWTPSDARNTAKRTHICMTQNRKLWVKECRDHYLGYAPYIDHFMGYWSDPCHCKCEKCDFATSIKGQMEYHSMFTKLNSKITTSYNTWYLDGWNQVSGKKGSKFNKKNEPLEFPSLLSKEVIIAIADHTKNHSEYYTSVKNAGYKAALWKWHLIDDEMNPSMHIPLQTMNSYMDKVIKKCPDLEFQTSPRNAHELSNVIIYYIFPRLLWDPSLNAYDLAHEFVELVFDKQNVDTIYNSFLAIDYLRNRGTKLRLKTNLDKINYLNKQIDALSIVNVNSSHKPRLSLLLSREGIVEDLSQSLKALLYKVEFYDKTFPELLNAVKALEANEANQTINDFISKYETRTIHNNKELHDISSYVNAAKYLLKLKTLLDINEADKAKKLLSLKGNGTMTREEQKAQKLCKNIHKKKDAPLVALNKLYTEIASRIEGNNSKNDVVKDKKYEEMMQRVKDGEEAAK